MNRRVVDELVVWTKDLIEVDLKCAIVLTYSHT